MNEKQLAKYKQLKLIFWANIIVFVLVLLGVLYTKAPHLNPVGDSAVFQRYAIIATLGLIPLALKLFHKRLMKLKEKSEELFVSGYMRLFMGRIALLDIALIINLFGLYYFEHKNFIFMCIITIFALVFTYPSLSDWERKSEVIEEDGTELEEETEINTNQDKEEEI